MFKENRFIYQFEFIPSKLSPSKRPKYREYNPEIPKEVKEKEKKEKEDSLRVAEKIIDELEKAGIKCPRCGLKNVRMNDLIKNKDPKKNYLRCLDCNYKWEEIKKNS